MPRPFCIAAALLSLTAAVSPAFAAPPTVQFSPGYDAARLAASRKGAVTSQSTTVQTVKPVPPEFSPLNKRRNHHH